MNYFCNFLNILILAKQELPDSKISSDKVFDFFYSSVMETDKPKYWLQTHYRVKLLGFEFQFQHLLKFDHGQITLLSVLQFPSLKTGYNHNSILYLCLCEELK